MPDYNRIAEKAWQAILAKAKEMEANGVRQAEISRLLGHKGRSAVSNWLKEEATAKNASFGDMLRYLDVLGLNPLNYLPLKEKPSQSRGRESFSDKFYRILKEKNQERGWQSAFAKKAGISQSSLSKIISGETKAPELSTVSAIIDALGDELLSPHPATRRMGAYSPVEEAIGENDIPVYAAAGAGPALWPDEQSPLFSVSIPSAYMHPSDFAILVDGHSMEPGIPHGAIVGIWKNAPFKANEVYLANIPYEGLVVKRVGVDREREEFVFKSENPDKTVYPDFRGYLIIKMW